MKPTSIILLCAAACLLAGCTNLGRKPDMLQSRVEGARITSEHLRTLTYELAVSCADQVSAAADQIKDHTDSPQIRRNALLWKINFIPACFQAASRREALLAFADVWILCLQTEQFLETGSGKASFGPQQPIALDNAKAMQTRADIVARSIFTAGDVPAQNRANIEKFAQDFPIQSLEFQRESILLHQTDLVPAQSANLAELAADVQQDLGILQLTLNAHAAYLPRIARWQAELLLYDLDQTPTIATSVGVLKQVPEIVQDVVGKQLPALVDRERTSVLAAIHQERVETLESVEKMRQATIDSIVAQRLAIIEMLVSERAAVLKQVDTERTETMREARAIAKDTVVSALPTGNALIDHFYWRLVEFAVPLLLMCGVGLLIIRNTVAKAVAGKARTDRG